MHWCEFLRFFIFVCFWRGGWISSNLGTSLSCFGDFFMSCRPDAHSWSNEATCIFSSGWCWRSTAGTTLAAAFSKKRFGEAENFHGNLRGPPPNLKLEDSWFSILCCLVVSKIFVYFHPQKLGTIFPIWRAYFSDRVVKKKHHLVWGSWECSLKKITGLTLAEKQGIIAPPGIYHRYLGLSPFQVTVTTRIIPFSVGNPYKPSFAIVTGKGTTQEIPKMTPSLKGDTLSKPSWIIAIVSPGVL